MTVASGGVLTFASAIAKVVLREVIVLPIGPVLVEAGIKLADQCLIIVRSS